MEKYGNTILVRAVRLGFLLGTVLLGVAGCRVEVKPPTEPIVINVRVEVHIYQHAVRDIAYVTGGKTGNETVHETTNEVNATSRSGSSDYGSIAVANRKDNEPFDPSVYFSQTKMKRYSIFTNQTQNNQKEEGQMKKIRLAGSGSVRNGMVRVVALAMVAVTCVFFTGQACAGVMVRTSMSGDEHQALSAQELETGAQVQEVSAGGDDALAVIGGVFLALLLIGLVAAAAATPTA